MPGNARCVRERWLGGRQRLVGSCFARGLEPISFIRPCGRHPWTLGGRGPRGVHQSGGTLVVSAEETSGQRGSDCAPDHEGRSNHAGFPRQCNGPSGRNGLGCDRAGQHELAACGIVVDRDVTGRLAQGQ
jgi:hypothetical protein